MVVVNPIRSEAEYDTALGEVEALIAARRSTREGDRADILATQIQAYEAEHHAIGAPDLQSSEPKMWTR